MPNLQKPNLENLKKQAKILVRWRREGRLALAHRIRAVLPDFSGMTDAEILAAPFQLAQAQELLAREHGFDSWQALKDGAERMSEADQPSSQQPAAQAAGSEPALVIAFPQVFVRDVSASIAFYRDKLGFQVVHAWGDPVFYALIARGGAVLNLRHVGEAVFVDGARARQELLAANIVVKNVKALFLEFQGKAAPIQQTLTKQPWGAWDFSVRDPDGNLILFASRNDEP